eukprot:1155118-Pelagomonas_calceolata.AAC.4
MPPGPDGMLCYCKCLDHSCSAGSWQLPVVVRHVVLSEVCAADESLSQLSKGLLTGTLLLQLQAALAGRLCYGDTLPAEFAG